MKKFLAIAIIAASFTACNDTEKKVDEVKTSDTSVITTPAVADTMKVVTDTTVKTTVTTDTIKK
ncbi:MAG: hypothetical protein JWQ27_3227 [Ferruginibacter sp.]|nr:hypothetical protein [Ferruginibacter sp.]